MTAHIPTFTLLICLSGLTHAAGEIDLAGKIAAGDWLLTYRRAATFKPLGLKHKEGGTSHICMGADPRRQIMSWLTEKGCSVDRETMEDGAYRLHGSCRLKWWKGRPIPVSVELRPTSPATFGMEIRTDGDSLLGFTESTQATRQGDCPPASATKRKQDQGA